MLIELKPFLICPHIDIKCQMSAIFNFQSGSLGERLRAGLTPAVKVERGPSASATEPPVPGLSLHSLDPLTSTLGDTGTVDTHF